jgi:hypothetical protein
MNTSSKCYSGAARLMWFAMRVALLTLIGSSAACNNQGSNLLPINVSQGPGAGLTLNRPYTTITLCMANTPYCQTIDHVLVDTGSTGIRIFKQVLNANLAGPEDNQGWLGEYQAFGTGNSWGPVVGRLVTLGGEPSVSLKIQIIDSSWGGGVPDGYSSSWNSPDDAGFNGILGIGLSNPYPWDSGSYFSCQSGVCSILPSQPPIEYALENPVFLLPRDNNGIIISMPKISADGQTSASGTLVLGIGTQPDNDPKNFSANWLFTVPAKGLFEGTAHVTMTAANMSFNWLLPDSGTNSITFAPPLPGSYVHLNGTYCLPSPLQNFPTLISVPGTTSGTWPFTFAIECVDDLQPPNCVPSNPTQGETLCLVAFNDVGAASGIPYDDYFIFGLPLFYDRDVYIVYPDASAPLPLGKGPLYGFGGHPPGQ